MIEDYFTRVMIADRPFHVADLVVLPVEAALADFVERAAAQPDDEEDECQTA